MYRLSATEDLSFLKGAAVIQVCIGANEAILNLDYDVRITVLGEFSVSCADGATVRYDDPPRGAAALIGLLNDPIATAEATRCGDLQVTLASGARLVVFDSSSEYESFWIKGPNREIIV